MPRTPLFLACAAAALAGSLSAQDDQALRPATDAAWGTAILEVPLHRSPSDAAGEAAPLWAARASYKVALAEGFELHPCLGAEAPRSLPIAWRTRAVRVGAQTLERSAAPAVASEKWSYALHHESWIERYDVLPAGLEQSWVFTELPLNGGDLRIEGAISTPLECATRSAAHQALVFVDEQGNAVLSYGAAIAFDATGRSTQVVTRFDGEQIVLELAGEWLRQATLPVTVDPLVGPVFVSTNNGTGGISSNELACQRESAGQTQFLAFTRAFSAADYDAFAATCDQAFGAVTNVHADLATLYSDKEAAAVYVPGADRWIAAYQREFTNAQGDQSAMRLWFHDREVLTLNSGQGLSYQPAGLQALSLPDLGSSEGAQETRAILVCQRDSAGTRANSANSEILGLHIDAAARSVTSSFLPGILPVGSSLDREEPAINQVTASGWLIAWTEWDYLVAVEDWDLYGALVDANGNVVQSNRIDDAQGARHFRQPRVAGDYGNYVVTYTGSPDRTTTAGVEVRSRRLYWPNNASQPTQLAPARTLAGPTSIFLPVKNADLCYMTNTRSHWVATWNEARAGIQLPIRDIARAARLGNTGAIVESGVALDDTTFSASPVAVAYDVILDRCNLIGGPSSMTAPHRGFHFSYHVQAGVQPIGTGCGSGVISGNNMHAGNGGYGISLSNAPASTAAALLISLAGTNFPLDGVGMQGCILAVTPGNDLIASLSVTTNANGFTRINMPLPDFPLFQGTVYTQWAYLSPGSNSLGVQTTAGLAVSVY
jgi:hypothetical protein